MVEKLKELLNSVRFWQVTIGSVSAYLADVATNGFILAHLLMAVSIWLGVVASVGTLDSVATKLSSKKEEK